jgi:hypothetical protein
VVDVVTVTSVVVATAPLVESSSAEQPDATEATRTTATARRRCI